MSVLHQIFKDNVDMSDMAKLHARVNFNVSMIENIKHSLPELNSTILNLNAVVSVLKQDLAKLSSDAKQFVELDISNMLANVNSIKQDVDKLLTAIRKISKGDTNAFIDTIEHLINLDLNSLTKVIRDVDKLTSALNDAAHNDMTTFIAMLKNLNTIDLPNLQPQLDKNTHDLINLSGVNDTVVKLESNFTKVIDMLNALKLVVDTAVDRLTTAQVNIAALQSDAEYLKLNVDSLMSDVNVLKRVPRVCFNVKKNVATILKINCNTVITCYATPPFNICIVAAKILNISKTANALAVTYHDEDDETQLKPLNVVTTDNTLTLVFDDNVKVFSGDNLVSEFTMALPTMSTITSDAWLYVSSFSSSLKPTITSYAARGAFSSPLVYSQQFDDDD